MAPARGQAARRRRAGGLPQRRQIHADLGGRRGEAQDRRLPLHDARAAPRCRALRDHEFVLADIPGLIEGAAEGRGLGHAVPSPRRTGACALVLLLDLASVDGRSPEEQERVLLVELEQYRPELLDRPRLVVGSKADVATSELRDPDAITLSAVTRTGLDEFLGRLGSLVDEARATEPDADEPFVTLRPVEEGFAVVRDDDGAWRVTGRSAAACRAQWPTSPTKKRSSTSRSASAGWASSARWPRAVCVRRRRRARRSCGARVPGGDLLMAPTAVVKVGSSSITSDSGEPDDVALSKLCGEIGRRASAAMRSCWCRPARSRPGCPRSASSAVRRRSDSSRPSPPSASRS